MKEILPVDLKLMMQEGINYQLIDVREPAEREAVNIGGELIPLDELMSNIHKIDKDKPVIIYCKVGLRSHIAIQRLQEKYGYENLLNLKGGITAYLSM
ncbi:MAG: rhodanese-like domain-containing protein [Chitinophagaceae bacterium]|nr:rhodanese-like domain-containing protein [Chitinophagaceae bacterium]